MNIVTKEKYTYILYSTESSAVKWTPTRQFNRQLYITKIPTKFLTGDNFKDKE